MPRWAVVGLGAVAIFLAGLYFGGGGRFAFLPKGPPPEPAADTETAAPTARSEPAEPERPARRTADRPRTEPAPVDRPAVAEAARPSTTVDVAPATSNTEAPVTVAVVIDDLGRSLTEVERIASLGVPITFAVLPFESRTKEVARAIAETGAEMLVHLPMEPSNGADPGPGALTLGMTASQLAVATRRSLEAVPGATGVNNHMGSTLSADEASMRAVLGVVAERKMFFLDSRTSAKSVGYPTAMALGIPAAERQVFLDDDKSPEAIRKQFARLVDLATERGAAIAIGHPYDETLVILAEEIPKARARGVQFVPVSYLVDRAVAAEP